jgi:GTP-binding protein
MIDLVRITVRSGTGGSGSGSFRREKFIPKGGPDGGDGGDGGSVWIVADDQRNTLQHFQGAKVFAAKNGLDGGEKKMFGAKAEDIEVPVPLGTVIWEIFDEHTPEEQKRKVGEILTKDDRFIIAHGGLGGRGNVHFKSSVNTTPLEYERGGEEQTKRLLLELKLLADVGFVGFPNAGKSTLLASLTKAQPKIANYPFTTISPNLGILSLETVEGTSASYILADIPGLIEQASEGKGLGHHFLRHIERCRLLLYVLSYDENMLFASDADADSLAKSLGEQWEILQKELATFNPELVRRPTMVVLNKADLIPADIVEVSRKYLLAHRPENVQPEDILVISGATHQGLQELTQALHHRLQALPRTFEASEEPEVEELPVFGLNTNTTIGPNKPRLARKDRP